MAASESLRLTTSDGVSLEARWDRAGKGDLAAVFCHPDPLQGGTMYAPLMNGVTDRLVARGISVLRFNFRGTGASGGRPTGGDDEVIDVDAAYLAAAEAGGRLAVGGWSFGAAMGLRWLAWSGIGLPYVGIAPATTLAPLPEALPTARRLIIVGARDQIVDVPALRGYAERSGARLVEVAGSDHFFHLRAERVGDLVADFLGEPTRPE